MTYSDDELKELATIARKFNLLIISDEIYAWLNHKGQHPSLNITQRELLLHQVFQNGVALVDGDSALVYFLKM